MQPRIENLGAKKLVGHKMSMTLANNKTAELWRGFMPRRKEIGNMVGTDLFSLQVYNPSQKMHELDLDTCFEKWAAVEVTDFTNIPPEMETLNLVDGLYAVFLHKGAASTGAKTFQYIFGTWLPASAYDIDNTRPHFEI